jgi:hypothetical protein
MLRCACGFVCDRAYSLERHRKSKKHEMNMAEMQCLKNELGVYHCINCNFSTTFRGNYRQHLVSSKHASSSSSSSKDTTTVVKVVEEPKPVLLIEVMEMFMKHQENVMKHHQESVVKHQETTQIQNTEMFKALADRIVACNKSVSPPLQIENVIQQQNHTNSHNKKFNLNFFLNEECKNAQNLTDFVKNVVVSQEDLEHLGQVGYTEGMTKILTKALVEKEHTERPMHCTDIKRETIYIRENDAWKKDVQREETVRAIEHIAHKNYKVFMEWRNQHPEHAVPDTEDYETWYRISRNMCNTDPMALKKLVHHLATITAIEKGEMMLTE